MGSCDIAEACSSKCGLPTPAVLACHITQANNEDVYNGTVRDLVSGVLYGINTTVFAYGSTGSGKTYTMVRSMP